MLCSMMTFGYCCEAQQSGMGVTTSPLVAPHRVILSISYVVGTPGDHFGMWLQQRTAVSDSARCGDSSGIKCDVLENAPAIVELTCGKANQLTNDIEALISDTALSDIWVPRCFLQYWCSKYNTS